MAVKWLQCGGTVKLRRNRYLEGGVCQHGGRVFVLLGAQFSLVLETVLSVVDRAAREAVHASADVAEELVDVVVVRTPPGTVGRRAVVAVCVAALRLASAQLQVLLIDLLGYELKTYG